MPNIVIPNTLLNTSNEKFHAMWKLTRGLLAAGWRYKASSDGFQKDSTGNDSQDFWSVGGFTNLTGVAGQSGSGATISIPITASGTSPPDIKITGTPAAAGPHNLRIEITTGGVRTVAVFRYSIDGGNTWTSNVTTSVTNALTGTGLTVNWPAVVSYTNDNVYVTSSTFLVVSGLTGMTVNSVGHALTISGAVNAGNNGTFRIASFISATSVTVYNPFGPGLTAYNNAGTGASLGTLVGVTMPLTGGAGFSPASVGRYITLTGCASAANNGTFPITAFNSATSISYTNAAGVSLDANSPNIRWIESVSATTAAPYVDGASGFVSWVEKAGGVVANVTTVANGIATLTGLTGMTTASVGHRITIINATSGGNNGTFLIVAYNSATSVNILNPSAVATDANNGAIHWTERDPALDTYPPSVAFTTVDHGVGAWINLQGPSTMKFPIGTANPTPAFTRGEKVTQAATGCEGEFMGAVIDATGGTGFIVVAPRVNGSGGNARGWDASAIAAAGAPAGSGATVTPTAAGIEFVREFVIWKNTNLAGHIYYQCIDQLSEATPSFTVGRFSTMAALATCTPLICPGGAIGTPLVNGFPTLGTLCCTGTGGSGAAATGSLDYNSQSVSTTLVGNIQVICANNIEATGVSQDGTFSVLIGGVTAPAISFTFHNLNGFHRLDDGEEGDVDPYVCYWPSGTAAGARSRTVNTTANAATGDGASNIVPAAGTLTSTLGYVGFRRRSFTTGDAFTEFSGFCLTTSTSSLWVLGQNITSPDSVACTFISPAPRVREPIWIACYIPNQKMRKGTLRWWYSSPGGNCGDTLDSKRFAHFSSLSTTAGCTMAIGPWDGASVPSPM